MDMTVHFSSVKDDWETPQYILDELDREFNFDADGACTAENCKFGICFTDTFNADWKGLTVFMNPPYGRGIGKFIEKAYNESLKGATVVCLLPARVDTKWFHDYCLKGEVRFVKGRIKFRGAENNAPFPSMIVVFKGQEQ